MIRVLIHYTTNWDKVAEITIPVLEMYCGKHGYYQSVYRHTPYEFYTGREKINQILEVCEDGDIALVLDADTIITNPKIKVEDFINDEQDFYITNHVGKVNSGVFIVRMSMWSRTFLDYILTVIDRETVYCEQDAIMKYINSFTPDKKMCILPHPSINSLMYNLYSEHGDIRSEEDGNWKPNHFLLHLPGIGMEKRAEILKQVKDTL